MARTIKATFVLILGLAAIILSRILDSLESARIERLPALEVGRPSSTPLPPLAIAKNPESIPTAFEVAWLDLANEVADLGADDQIGLDRLYAKAAALIEQDLTSAKSLMIKNLSKIENRNQSYEQIFFAVSAWTRYSADPTMLIRHLAASSETRDNRVFAYSLREVRHQLQQNLWLSKDDADQFIKQLNKIAKTERSFDISIEALKLLKLLKEDTEPAIISRPPEDRDLLRATI
jgi:hypothetical protein